MSKSNFQHFLKVLEEMEGERTLPTIPEKQSMKSPERGTEKVMPVWDIKSVKQSCKAKRSFLKRPGFIYRTKDLARTSYLDSNLWEFTACGRRILKSPSFKYRQKRKSSASPYSAKVLEGLDRLSLAASSTPLHSCHAENPEIQPQKDLTPHQAKFLPMKKSALYVSNTNKLTAVKLKHLRPVISPGKLGSAPVNKTVKDASTLSKAEKGDTNLFTCSTAIDSPTFSSLSARIEPLVVRKYASCSFVDVRDHCSSESNRDDTAKSIAAGVEANSLSDPSKESEPCRSLTSKKPIPGIERSCSFQARMCEQDMSVDEMSIYMEDILFLPQKMSTMAEMMYT